MYSRLQKFFDRHMRQLLQGHLAEFVSDYDFPMALHLQDALVVYPSAGKMLEATQDYHSWLVATGVTSMRVRLNAVDIPRQERFRVWTTIFQARGSGQPANRTESIYYLRRKRGRFLIEMVNCTETSDAEFLRTRQTLRQTA